MISVNNKFAVFAIFNILVAFVVKKKYINMTVAINPSKILIELEYIEIPEKFVVFTEMRYVTMSNGIIIIDEYKITLDTF
jgi:hypothetical protein